MLERKNMNYLEHFISKNEVHLTCISCGLFLCKLAESSKHVLAGFYANVHLQEIALNI